MIPYSDQLDWPAGLAPFAPNDTDIQADPYDHYTWMREHAPVLRTATPTGDVWLLSRYEDVSVGFRDHRRFSSATADPKVLPFLITQDPPNHTRLRMTVTRAFTPKAIARMENFVRDLATQTYGRYLEAGGGRFAENFALPMTLGTIGEMLGIPIERFHDLRRWTKDVGNYFGRVGRNAPGSPTDASGTAEMLEFQKECLVAAAARTDETIAGNIAKAWKEGGLSESEALYFCTFLLIAGHETTTILLCNAVLLLAERPDLVKRLRERPADAPRFIEELVRWKPSAHRLARITTEDITMSGTTLPAGSRVRLLTASANRDERKFADPNRFDPDRDTSGHMGFGSGIHTCLGAFLARMESAVSLNEIVARTRTIELAGPETVLPYKGGAMANSGPTEVTMRVAAH